MISTCDSYPIFRLPRRAERPHRLPKRLSHTEAADLSRVYMGNRFIPAGRAYGKLVVVRRGSMDAIGHYRYIFLCQACGRTVETYPVNASAGHCGCLRPTLEERLVRFLLLNESKDCWEWQGWKNNKGYGMIGTGPHKLSYVHRVAWTLWRGNIPEGMCVLHKCDNGPCCNPDHLFLGTIADNNADCLAKGRHVSGFVIHRAWLKGHHETA